MGSPHPSFQVLTADCYHSSAYLATRKAPRQLLLLLEGGVEQGASREEWHRAHQQMGSQRLG